MEALRIECEGSGVLDVDKLVPFQGSLKTLSKENYLKLKAEMLAEGFSFPVFVWQHEGSNFIIDGHQRCNTLQEMKKEGYKIPPIPVAMVKAATYKQAKKKVLAAASVYGRIDDQGLYEFLNGAGIEIDEIVEKIDLPNFDLEKFIAGYQPENGGGGGNADPDDVPEPPKVAKTKLGDLYQLGNHRLLCGDSTKKEDVERLMGGEKAEMVFTDPLYGVSFVGLKGTMYSGGKKSGRDSATEIENDDLRGGDLTALFKGALVMAVKSTKPSAAFYIFFGINRSCETLPAVAEAGLNVRNWLVWDKGNVGFHAMGAQYKPNFEAFLYCHHDGQSPEWVGSANQQTIWRHSSERLGLHPTMKPISLIEQALGNHKAETILDLFLGSGSTLIACEKTNRKCYGMELDPIYCDVIISRWEQFTGKKAELIR